MIDLIGNKLCQWETDRKIKISNKEIVKLVFGSEQHCDGCPVDVVNGEVVIPDHLLQSPVAIEVYGVNAEGEEIYSCKFAVNSRRKPAGYCVPASGPDWNQNDPSAKDYVKNRPFWVEEERIAIFENEEAEDHTNAPYNPCWAFETTNSMILPSDGDKVVVVTNNVEHELVLRWNEDIEAFGTQTPDGQYEVFVYDAGAGEIAWGIESQNSFTASLYVFREAVHKIPEKYLPESVGGAENKAIVITATYNGSTDEIDYTINFTFDELLNAVMSRVLVDGWVYSEIGASRIISISNAYEGTNAMEIRSFYDSAMEYRVFEYRSDGTFIEK